MDNIDEVKAALLEDEFDFRYDCGVCKAPNTLYDCDRMVQTPCKHYAVMKILPQLKQLEEGFCFFEVLQLLRSNNMKALLISSPGESTSDVILDLFEPHLALEGNQLREVQEGVVLNWANYIQAVQGK